MAIGSPHRRGRQRKAGSSFTTHNGNTIKIKRSFSERRKAAKDAKARRRAAALATLPKNPFLRQVYRMHPKRMAQYWFSRDGAVMALKVVGVAVIVCFILLVGLFAYFRKDLPKINSLAGDKLGGSISYYDRTGKILLWQDYGAVKRLPVANSQMSPYMQNATVAIEDQHFYTEGAFNFKSIIRAGLHDVFGIGSSDGLQGGSTITQQLVKLNEQWTDNRTIGRKIKELILAIDLNREYTKKEILTGYLNIAPYGGVEYGCESAAEDYFNTTCKDLTLAQSAFLASIPQAPTAYSPYSDPKFNPAATEDLFNQQALINRKNYVLDQMVKLHMVTAAQAAQAKSVNLLATIHPLSPKYGNIKAPYFVLATKQYLEDKYGAATVDRGGWKVITTLNMDVENKANQLMQQNLPSLERGGGDEEAMVVEDAPTGQIVALVGGVDFNNPNYGNINYATIPISPGSSIKPYVYGTLINDTNAGAGSVLYDSQGPIIDPATGAGYPCTNKALPEDGGNCLWDDNRTYPGAETLRYALGGSRNVPAVKAFIQAGIKNTINTATKMMNPNAKQSLYNCYSNEALTQTATCGPAAGIGDGAYLTLANHVNGDASFARLGKSIPETYILKITDASGKVIDQYQQPQGKQVLNAQTAYIINNMLSDPRATYFTAGYKIQNWHGWDFAIKTGTTNDNSNILMTGWSTQYAVASWGGYHTTTKEMNSNLVSSDKQTYNMTSGMLEYLHEGKTPVNWQKPAGVQTLPAYVERSGFGDMFGAEFPSPSTDLYPSWYKPSAGAGQAVTIDRVSGKLATQCTPPAAREVVTNGNPNQFSIDQFYGKGTGGTNYNFSASDDVHNCNDTPPSVALSVIDPSNPSQQAVTCDSQDGCEITATATAGTHPLSSTQFPESLTISVNGKVVAQGSQPTLTYQFTPTASGTATISAQVTDSVLYSGSNSVTVNTTYTQPATPPSNGNSNGVGSGHTPPGQQGNTGP